MTRRRVGTPALAASLERPRTSYSGLPRCAGAHRFFLIAQHQACAVQGEEEGAAAAHASIQAILQEASAAALRQQLPVQPALFLPDDDRPGEPSPHPSLGSVRHAAAAARAGPAWAVLHPECTAADGRSCCPSGVTGKVAPWARMCLCPSS